MHTRRYEGRLSHHRRDTTVVFRFRAAQAGHSIQIQERKANQEAHDKKKLHFLPVFKCREKGAEEEDGFR